MSPCSANFSTQSRQAGYVVSSRGSNHYNSSSQQPSESSHSSFDERLHPQLRGNRQPVNDDSDDLQGPSGLQVNHDIVFDQTEPFRLSSWNSGIYTPGIHPPGVSRPSSLLPEQPLITFDSSGVQENRSITDVLQLSTPGLQAFPVSHYNTHPKQRLTSEDGLAQQPSHPRVTLGTELSSQSLQPYSSHSREDFRESTGTPSLEGQDSSFSGSESNGGHNSRKIRRLSRSPCSPGRSGQLKSSHGVWCESCDLVLKDRAGYRRHLKTKKHGIDPRQYKNKCDVGECEEAFQNPKDLDRHKRIHSNVREFHCRFPDCSFWKGFKRRDHLKRHIINKHSNYMLNSGFEGQ